MKVGASMHCSPTNNCEEGTTCIPARQVDRSYWVGTFCYDPVCASTRVTPAPTPAPTEQLTEIDVDNRDGDAIGVPLNPGLGTEGNLVEEMCWKDPCGTNTVCNGGLSCMSKGSSSCYCRDPTLYMSDCSKVMNGILDISDMTCEIEFHHDVWALTPGNTPPQTTSPPTVSGPPDLTRTDCMKVGASMHCLPTNDCEEGTTCIPASQVDRSNWVGTFCYDPVCASTPTPAPTESRLLSTVVDVDHRANNNVLSSWEGKLRGSQKRK